ncbi:putative cyclin-D6-1 [Senna tora]|uniref:B-like cyclin n=1 Tax=Senna tora TaxID=362788 RepID=A0A834SHC0_9FABA|nr:putative cyclin-D6-1 [Senna tora]
MEFDLEDPLGSSSSSSISKLFALESDHMPTYHHCFSFRCEAISLISQFLQLQFSCNLDPFVAYLAVNYLDRFVSRKEIEQGKPWLLRLIVISCLSLASKMNNIPFSLSDLQIEGCIFEAQSIQKMEFLILGALKWRMRSITPFSFLHFFISLAELELKDPSFKQALKHRASEIIFNAHYDIKFVGFKPSIVAASALISASHEVFPLQYSAVRASITACEYLHQETVSKCFNLMQEMEKIEAKESWFDYESSIISTEIPVSVLESNTKRRRI